MNLRQLKEFKMSVKMSDALRESINDINEILYAQKLIDKKNMNVLVRSFQWRRCQKKWMDVSLLRFAEN